MRSVGSGFHQTHHALVTFTDGDDQGGNIAERQFLALRQAGPGDWVESAKKAAVFAPLHRTATGGPAAHPHGSGDERLLYEPLVLPQVWNHGQPRKTMQGQIECGFRVRLVPRRAKLQRRQHGIVQTCRPHEYGSLGSCGTSRQTNKAVQHVDCRGSGKLSRRACCILTVHVRVSQQPFQLQPDLSLSQRRFGGPTRLRNSQHAGKPYPITRCKPFHLSNEVY